MSSAVGTVDTHKLLRKIGIGLTMGNKALKKF